MIALTQKSRIIQTLQTLINTPSPSGNTDRVIRFVEERFESLGIETKRNRKGGLIATIPGKNDREHRMLTAHVDTLGAMVKEIKPSGRLKIDLIGALSSTPLKANTVKWRPKTVR